jgi:apolipoprotein N-acyltransferase
LQIASLTGASGVSFVLVAFNLGLGFYLYNLWVNRRQRWWRRLSVEFYLSLGILFGAIAFGLQSSGAGKRGIIEGPRLGFVQPNVGALEKWEPGMVEENLDLLEDLTTYAAYLGAELILWPEAPTPYAVKGSPRMRAWVDALAREAGVPMLIGNLAVETGPGEDQRRYYNAVFTVSPDAGVDLERYYAKRHLVPFGEYLPMGDWIPFGRTVVPIPVDMTPGTQARPLRLPGSAGEVGILICYEDIFSGLARDNVRAGADWHYVATNNAWFGEEAAGWQHAAHSVLRAVETRRPVVRCGNAGWSGWIDEFGQIRHAMTDEAGSVYFQGVEAVPFQRNRWWSGRQSVYVAHGDWFPLVCAVLAGLGWMVFRFVPGSRGDRPGFVQSRLGRVSSGG